MNYLVKLSALLVLVYSSSILDSESKATIGVPCTNSNAFVISSFNVNPWPPTAGQTSALNFTGVSQASMQIGTIGYSIQNQNQMWYNEYQNVDQYYPASQNATFTYTMKWPLFAGTYLFQMNMHSSPNTQVIYSCWSFFFDLY
ncbi:hypothetical protein SteCoe_26111 [Stentor coeruleus]|uniref:Uncharacterized protein n=1 Tax=Stentor coeruleus TaxID=5963 RepID=A0A1R2BDK0_9CILI|nr:hypothetical protein SteCoe_26111 [Stentor coeruleus]